MTTALVAICSAVVLYLIGDTFYSKGYNQAAKDFMKQSVQIAVECGELTKSQGEARYEQMCEDTFNKDND